jgi:hypothetical protein
MQAYDAKECQMYFVMTVYVKPGRAYIIMDTAGKSVKMDSEIVNSASKS